MATDVIETHPVQDIGLWGDKRWYEATTVMFDGINAYLNQYSMY